MVNSYLLDLLRDRTQVIYFTFFCLQIAVRMLLGCCHCKQYIICSAQPGWFVVLTQLSINSVDILAR